MTKVKELSGWRLGKLCTCGRVKLNDLGASSAGGSGEAKGHIIGVCYMTRPRRWRGGRVQGPLAASLFRREYESRHDSLYRVTGHRAGVQGTIKLQPNESISGEWVINWGSLTVTHISLRGARGPGVQGASLPT